jgi:hypothetical protein
LVNSLCIYYMLSCWEKYENKELGNMGCCEMGAFI